MTYLPFAGFTTVLQCADDMDAAYVAVPMDIKAEFGKGRLNVRATFDGEEYAGSVVNMGVKQADGSICYIIGVPKAIRSIIDKQVGDTVAIALYECSR